jgi:hypothetical protein
MGHSPTAGFTGRSYELAAVDQALTTARDGLGSVVTVCGEAGIGKTAFCREISARARHRGFVTAWGSCWPLGGAPPLWPWPPILDALSGGGYDELFRDDPGSDGADPERFARFAAIVRELARSCATRPALVVVDDAHAADAGALLLARFVARNVAGLRLVLVITARGTPAFFQGLDLDSESTLVSLGGLAPVEAAEVLRAHGAGPVEDDVLDVLVRLTGGHPLYLQRLASTERGRATTSGRVGVESVIGEAIGRLSAVARSGLSRAAVLGSGASLVEAAAVADVAVRTMADSVAEAAGTGLVRCEPPEAFTYAHELIREAFEGALPPADQWACHARAAARFAPHTSWERLTRYAHHAVRAAPRSPADASAAVAACRSAAAAMVAGYSYEEAAALLRQAVAVHEDAGLSDPVALLRTERAEAVLKCGRLGDARLLFDEAVSAALAEGDAVCLARATLGLGGVWLNEHRTFLEWDRVSALQRRALAALAPSERILRARLTMRLAADDLYRGGPLEPVLTGLDEARSLGDGTALAEALSLTHHALLTAAHTGLRLALAEELIAVAAPAGEGLLALFGLCWRTVDLFHVGDVQAVRSWTELRERADALKCMSVLYVADAMHVMLLIRAGRLDEAEQAALACYSLGLQVGDADAAGYLAAQLSTIRWCQGRDAEMVGQLAQLAESSQLNPAEFAFHATYAHLLARAGQLNQARVALAQLVEQGLHQLPDSSTWLAGMLAIAQSARLLGETEVCRQAYALLEPYAELPIMPSLAVTCLGSVHRPHGLAALAMGATQVGIRHLQRAVEANRAYGNRPVTAITMTELAEAYVERHGVADRRLAIDLMSAALHEAESMAMTGYLDGWRQRLDDLRDDSGVIEHLGEHWVLTLGGRRVEVADRVGVRYLSLLLTNPGRAIPASQLVAGADTALPAPAAQVVLDDRAKDEYRRRLTALATALDQAEDDGDDHRVELLRDEREALLEELRSATGLHGQSRTFAGPAERARTSVRKALMRAIEEISTVEPAIGKRILASVSTGSTCCYSPDPEHPVRWRSSVGAPAN